MKNLNARVQVPYVKKNALEKQHSAEALLQTFQDIKALFIPYSVSYTRNGQPTQTVQPESFVWTSSTFS